MARIRIIEDDSKTAHAVCSGLHSEGYDVSSALAGDTGLSLLENELFDVVVLDWMLPKRSGIEILNSLRGAANRTPVLLLTARDAIEDRVMGLDAGADDYLIKPFAFAELLARLRELLRRSGDAELLRRHVGDLEIDLEHRRASRGGKSIALTPREFDLPCDPERQSERRRSAIGRKPSGTQATFESVVPGACCAGERVAAPSSRCAFSATQ